MDQFRKVVSINVILILLFIFSEYQIWNFVSEPPSLARIGWNPFSFVVSRHTYENGSLISETMIHNIPNLPFLLFLISIAVNLYYLSKKEV